jgi:hypothetical protein
LNDETRKDDLADATREAAKKADQINAAAKNNDLNEIRDLLKDLDDLRDRINKAAVYVSLTSLFSQSYMCDFVELFHITGVKWLPIQQRRRKLQKHFKNSMT